jgi:hypothetical protein
MLEHSSNTAGSLEVAPEDVPDFGGTHMKFGEGKLQILGWERNSGGSAGPDPAQLPIF